MTDTSNRPPWWNTVEQESASAGVDSDVLWRISGAESTHGQSTGRNPTSSASGVFQITDPTAQGLRSAYPSKNFRNTLDDNENARMAPWLLRSNNAAFAATVGRAPTPAEQYLGWFLGAKGGPRISTVDPSTPIEQVTGADQRAANPTVFANIRTAGDMLAWADRKMNGLGSGHVSLDTSVPMTPISDTERAAEAAVRGQEAWGFAGATYETLRQDSLTANIMRDFGDARFSPDPNFNATPQMIQQDERLKDIPDQNKGYLLGAVSQEDYDARITSLQKQDDYERHMAASGATGVWARMLGNMLDPAGWLAFAIPGGGETKLGKVLWDGASNAIYSAADAGYRERYNTSASPEALLWGAAGGAAFGLGAGGLFHGILHPLLSGETKTIRSAGEAVSQGLEAKANGATAKEAMDRANAAALKAPPEPSPEGGAPLVSHEAAPSPVTYLPEDVYHRVILGRARDLDPQGFDRAVQLDTDIAAYRARIAQTSAPLRPVMIAQNQLEDLRAQLASTSLGKPWELQSISEKIAGLEDTTKRVNLDAQARADERVKIMTDRLSSLMDERAKLERQLELSVKYARARADDLRIVPETAEEVGRPAPATVPLRRDPQWPPASPRRPLHRVLSRVLRTRALRHTRALSSRPERTPRTGCTRSPGRPTTRPR